MKLLKLLELSKLSKLLKLLWVIGLPTIWAAAEAAEFPARIVLEAEEFAVRGGDWKAKPYGTNYFCATFANTFLSRMAYLCAPSQGRGSVAERTIQVPHDGTYQVWARYELPYDYNVMFGIKIQQDGRSVFKRVYGRRESAKLWPFRQGIKPMVRYDWGGGDNIVWEGHDTAAKLRAGSATIVLIAGQQPEPAAERHVDVVLLTDDVAGVQQQMQKASYLPLDGWLTLQGRIFARLHNKSTVGRVRLESFSAVRGNACYEHSPYFIHVRDWPKHLSLPPDHSFLGAEQSTDWLDIGQQIDALNDSTWSAEIKVSDAEQAEVVFEIAAADRAGKRRTVRTLRFTAPTQVHLVIPADIGPRSEILTVTEELERLCRRVERFPKFGRIPQRILIFGIGEFVGSQSRWAGVESLLERYRALMGSNTVRRLPPNGAKYPLPKRRFLVGHLLPTLEWIKKLDEEEAKQLAVISFGDEIHIPAVEPKPELNEAFRQYLAEHRVSRVSLQGGSHPGEGVPSYPAEVSLTKQPTDRLYYWSQMFGFDEALKSYREAVGVAEAHLGRGTVWCGANYSPHPHYFPRYRQWIRAFQTRAMTLPWSQDYVWGVPELSVQVTGYLLTAFRCAARPHDLPILYYAMPHEPGNTPRDFRLSYFTALAHGAKMMHFFCATPLSVSYTENYISPREPEMFRAVYDVVRETGIAEDYLYDSHVRRGTVALLSSGTTEILGDGVNWNLETKCLYYALRHAQLPVEFITEEEIASGELKHYKALYVAADHFLSKAIPSLRSWVESGGMLFCTAGGGLTNEFNELNADMASLLGIVPAPLEGEPPPTFIKQELPRIQPLDEVTCQRFLADFPALLYKRPIRSLNADAEVIGTFRDGSPAVVTKRLGRGSVYFVGTLPGAAYVRRAIPIRPWDRSTTDEGMNHFLPTDFDRRVLELIARPARDAGVTPFVECSAPLIEATLLESPNRAAVVLLNFSGKPIQNMKVRIANIAPIRSLRTLHSESIVFQQVGKDIITSLPVAVADILLITR